MNAREFLRQLELFQPNEVLVLPVVIQLEPDSRETVDESALWNYINSLVISKNPAYIEVSGWQIVDDMHHLEYYDPLNCALTRLFALPVKHIHFNFGCVDEVSSLVDRAAQCIGLCYRDLLRTRSADQSEAFTEMSCMPMLTYEVKAYENDESRVRFFTQTRAAFSQNKPLLEITRAKVYEKSKRYDDALMCYHDAILLYPDNVDIYRARALLHTKLDNKLCAINDFKSAIECRRKHDHNEIDILNLELDLAEVLMKFNDFERDVEAAGMLVPYYQKSEYLVKLFSIMHDLYARFYRYGKQHAKLITSDSGDHIKEALDGFNRAIQYSSGTFSKANLARGKFYLQYYQSNFLQSVIGVKDPKTIIEYAKRDFTAIPDWDYYYCDAKSKLVTCDNLLWSMTPMMARVHLFFSNVSRVIGERIYTPSPSSSSGQQSSSAQPSKQY